MKSLNKLIWLKLRNIKYKEKVLKNVNNITFFEFICLLNKFSFS